jgi:hypothetical protein
MYVFLTLSLTLFFFVHTTSPPPCFQNVQYLRDGVPSLLTRDHLRWASRSLPAAQPEVWVCNLRLWFLWACRWKMYRHKTVFGLCVSDCEGSSSHKFRRAFFRPHAHRPHAWSDSRCGKMWHSSGSNAETTNQAVSPEKGCFTHRL